MQAVPAEPGDARIKVATEEAARTSRLAIGKEPPIEYGGRRQRPFLAKQNLSAHRTRAGSSPLCETMRRTSPRVRDVTAAGPPSNEEA